MLKQKGMPCAVRWCFPQPKYILCQGQARGYGRITQFCPLPFWGHNLHVVTVANSMDRILSTRHRMKDMNMILPQFWLRGLVTVVGQNWVVFSVFQKVAIFIHQQKSFQIFFFFKMLSFTDELTQNHETNCKWLLKSQIFMSRRKLSKNFSHFFSFKV